MICKIASITDIKIKCWYSFQGHQHPSLVSKEFNVFCVNNKDETSIDCKVQKISMRAHNLCLLFFHLLYTFKVQSHVRCEDSKYLLVPLKQQPAALETWLNDITLVWEAAAGHTVVSLPFLIHLGKKSCVKLIQKSLLFNLGCQKVRRYS